MNKRNISFSQAVRRYGLPFLLSVLLPILLLALLYAKEGIYWNSARTMLASDAFPQLANFYASYHDVLLGKESFFYTWSGALGGNYWALSAYYINSLFTFLVALVDKAQIPDIMYLITLLKFGAAGGSFWIFSHQTTKLSRWMNTTFSVSYALMSFSVAYSPMMMWLDALIYLPLIILGIHRIQEKRKPLLLFISYLLLFLSNFYMAFMVGVFSFLYFMGRLYTDRKEFGGTVPMYLITSFLAGGASMITILPTVLDLRNNGEALTELTQFWTPDTGAWDVVVKSMVGVYDTAKFEAAPFLYVGILPLLLACLYFFSKGISKRRKWLSGGMLLLLVLSIYVYPLNLFWHGFHAPNMLLFRFSFLYSFFLLILAQRGMEQLEEQKVDTLLNVAIGLVLVFLAAFLLADPKRYDYLTRENVFSTFLFLVAYFLLLLGMIKGIGGKRWQSLFVFLLLFGGLAEAGVNTEAMLQGVKKDWNYPLRNVYSDSYEELETLVDQTEEEDSGFFRMANLDWMSINESFNFGYSGISQFSSIRNRRALSYLNKMGFRSEGTNLTIEYQNNTLFMDSLFGIKYNLAKEDPLKFGFEKVGEQGEYSLYENQYALPLGMMTDEGIYEEGVAENQTALIQYLSQQSDTYVRFTEPKIKASENVQIEEEGDFVYYSAEQPDKEMTIDWTVSAPAHSQVYLSLYAEDIAMMTSAKATVTVNGISRTYEMKKVNQYYNLGYTEEAESIDVSVTFQGASVIRLLKPDVLLLDTQVFKNSVEAIQTRGVEFMVEKGQAQATIDIDESGVLVTTIPYDSGWKAELDGEEIPITAFKEALISVSIPEGSHMLVLRYQPEGFKVGAVLFGGCLLVFSGYLVYLKKRDRKGRISDEKSI